MGRIRKFRHSISERNEEYEVEPNVIHTLRVVQCYFTYCPFCQLITCEGKDYRLAISQTPEVFDELGIEVCPFHENNSQITKYISDTESEFVSNFIKEVKIEYKIVKRITLTEDKKEDEIQVEDLERREIIHREINYDDIEIQQQQKIKN